MVYFRFAPEILRRLGEELNPSPEVGILELVKNSHDADAQICTVELIDTDALGGIVKVTDDGDGMSAESIADGWLVLGRSQKSMQQRTRLGRLQAGSKGLGRLAAMRMGSVAQLITRPHQESKKEYDLTIEWAKYDNVNTVEDVALTINERERASENSTGTEIIISGLRSRIGRMSVKKLARALILLADPFDDSAVGFKPKLKASAYTDLENLVTKKYFDEADYHLIANVTNGVAAARLTDWKGNILYSATHNELSTKARGMSLYECPDASFDLWTFLLRKDMFASRATTVQEVREWLRVLGGVHLYENGLRVSPYGDPGNDWLEINLRRAQLSEERPSTNNSIGRVSVTDSDGVLLQKTDRSGFIEGEAFIELKGFAQDALEWMGRKRLEIAEKRRANDRAPKKSLKAKRNIESVIAKAPQESQGELQEAFSAYDRSREREIKGLRKEIQLYRTLSTAGITAATFAHEASGNPIKVIDLSIKIIEHRTKRKFAAEYVTKLKEPVDRVINATKSLSVLGEATLKMLYHEKRRASRVDVHRVINGVVDILTPFLDGRGVNVERNFCPGQPYLRGSEAALESVITNLLNNSLAAFEHVSNPARKILIETIPDHESLIIIVSDNGPGIRDIPIKEIWLPGLTTRANGTGLGLTIVRDSVQDLGGSVDAVAEGQLGGAEIIIKVPIIGVQR